MTKVSGIGKQTPGITFLLDRNVKSVAQRLEKMTMAMMKLKSGWKADWISSKGDGHIDFIDGKTPFIKFILLSLYL